MNHPNTSWWMERCIRNRVSIEGNNFRGETYPQLSPFNRLPDVWEQDFRDAQVEYAVYSWNTPIAWYVKDEGWVMPNVMYSSYTTRHQRIMYGILGAAMPVRTIPLSVIERTKVIFARRPHVDPVPWVGRTRQGEWVRGTTPEEVNRDSRTFGWAMYAPRTRRQIQQEKRQERSA